MTKGELARRVEELLAAREPFVHATVVRAVTPTSVHPGDTAIVLADGTIEGFVGGACSQTSVRVHSARALETGQAVLLRLEPGVGPEAVTPEEGVVVARNPCLSGGAFDIFLEPQVPARRLVVAGDTPIALAVADVAAAAGYDVVRCAPGAVEPQPTDAALIVASHGEDEELALARGIAAGVGYVGLVASRKRGPSVLAALDADEATRGAIHTPAGLDIGARTAGEVAVAILAELVAEGGRAPVIAGPAPAAPEIAIDPVCGMEVVASDASVHLDTDAGRVYFCREGCRDAYLARL